LVQAKAFTGDPLYPIASGRQGQGFFPDGHTEPGASELIGPGQYGEQFVATFPRVLENAPEFTGI